MAELRVGPESGEGFYLMRGKDIELHVFSPANPNEIVRAVNSHDTLLSACKAALEWFPESCACHESYTSRDLQDPTCLYCDGKDEIEQLKAAIEKAES